MCRKRLHRLLKQKVKYKPKIVTVQTYLMLEKTEKYRFFFKKNEKFCIFKFQLPLIRRHSMGILHNIQLKIEPNYIVELTHLIQLELQI